MGCVVNGPGESKHANIGISLPGTFEEPKAPVYVDGRLMTTLRGDTIVQDFKKSSTITFAQGTAAGSWKQLRYSANVACPERAAGESNGFGPTTERRNTNWKPRPPRSTTNPGAPCLDFETWEQREALRI